MSCFEKQIVLHGLYLPKDVIQVIKDFAFTDTSSSTRKKKNAIMRHIINSLWCGRARPRDVDDGRLILWFEDDGFCPQFAIEFCKKCGNYNQSHTNYPHSGRAMKVLCTCLDRQFLFMW